MNNNIIFLDLHFIIFIYIEPTLNMEVEDSMPSNPCSAMNPLFSIVPQGIMPEESTPIGSHRLVLGSLSP
jgi:hypothetical protein